MKKFRLAVGLIGSVWLAACTATPPAEVVQTSSYEAVPADPVICRRVAPIGSHLKRRVCYRKSRWAEMTRAAQEAMGNADSGTTLDQR